MLVIRRFEEKAAEMYQRAKIGGYCHLNLGEEATCVGLGLALRPTDYLFTNYREHGYALARGIEPGRVMAELFGREDGVSRGRGGSMHLFDVEKRLMGGYAIVGGQLPAGHRRRARARTPGTRRGRALPDGRRHDQHRRLPRVAQPGLALEAADRLR